MKKLVIFFVLLSVVSAGRCFAEDRDDLVRTKSFTVSKGGTVDVTVNGGDIRIVTWEKNEVFIKARGTEENDLDRLDMELSGSTVIVNNREGWGSSDLSFDISIPSSFNCELRTSNGAIDIRGPLNGNIHGSTSAGDIRVSGAVTGNIDVTTSAGNIRTGDIQGDLRLNTSGGDITVADVSGAADIHTSGGNIRVMNVRKTLNAKTSGGDVIIGDVGGEADVSTSGGNVSVGKVSGTAHLATAGGDIDLRGASGNIRVKTAGGSLRLENITGVIDARTAGGDIDAELIPEGHGTSRLATAAGIIRLEVPENAKATINARIRVQGSWRMNREDYHIRSDFKAQTQENDKEIQEIKATYLLNGGGETITLETVNADIEIRKMGTHPQK